MKLSKGSIFIFLGPAVILVLAIFLYPVFRTTAMSFFDVKEIISPVRKWNFVGLGNYRLLYKTQLFITSMKNILKLWLYCGAITMFLSFLFSIALTTEIIGKKFFRALVYLPNVIASIAIGYMWLFYVFNNQFGLFKTLFSFLRLDSLAQIQWLSSNYIFYSMSIAFIFSNVGYYMMMFIAGIEKISSDYYEAARIEGAGVFQCFFKITLPLIKGVFATAAVLWTSRTMGFFALAQVFIGIKTYTPMLYTYIVLFGTEFTSTANNAGLAASSAVTMTIIVIIVSTLIQKLIKDENHEG
jgi:ABC-type sugar transport system permease subunit